MHNFEKPGEIEKYAEYLASLGDVCSSTEGIAVDAINYLYNRFGDFDKKHNCALMRFFRTVAYPDLTPYLQSKVKSSLGYEPQPNTNCLALLATRGIEPAWNDRLASQNHQVIPLLSTQMIEKAPMIAQLLEQLGISASDAVEPQPTLFVSPKNKFYSVMYTSEAEKSRDVFAQAEFVEPYGVRSVIGFGSLLPTGDVFAVLMFMRQVVLESTAERCTLLAQALETSVNTLRAAKMIPSRILVAAGTRGSERMRKLLGSSHQITYVKTTEEALSYIERENFDLIICGTSFDESRMFDLLREVKKQGNERAKPFICFRQAQSFLGDRTEAAIPTVASALGAACYIDAVQMSDAQLLEALHAYLPEEIWDHAPSV